MIPKDYIKPKLTIAEIGQQRFYLGIIAGLLFSISLNFFFNYSREIFRIFSFTSDLLILSKIDVRLYDLFFSSISVTTGLGYTVFIWFAKSKNFKKKKSYYNWFIVSASFLYIFIPILVICRLGSILSFLPYSLPTYDNDLNLIREFPIIFILCPVVIYFQHWSNIRLVYKTNYWIIKTSLILLIILLVQFAVIKIDKEKINKKYFKNYENEHCYVDNEIISARNKGIIIDSITSQKLKKNYAQSTLDLIENVTSSFKTKTKVSADTIVMLKIIVHNLKRDDNYFNMRYLDKNWRYPLPEDIYRQIILNKYKSIETEYLFEILKEIGNIFTIDINKTYEELDNMTDYERRIYFNRRLYLRETFTILSRYIQVCNKLREDINYEKYKHYLPVINFNEKKVYRQFWIDIEL